jgi:hypothetical protein
MSNIQSNIQPNIYQIPQQRIPQERIPQEQRKKSFSIKLLILIAVLVFLIVVIIWTIWAYFWFRYDYSRVNSKIIKRYMIANPNPFDKNTEDIKSDNITYNSNKTTLTADIIIFDKITRAHEKKDNILLKISETCIPVSSNCIKL